MRIFDAGHVQNALTATISASIFSRIFDSTGGRCSLRNQMVSSELHFTGLRGYMLNQAYTGYRAGSPT
jgi:hypothetical protein